MLFEPAYIKEARLVLKNGRNLMAYKRDVLPEAQRGEFQATIDDLDKAVRSRDRAGVEAAAQKLDSQWSKYLPPAKDAGWRENCEVFLVTIIIAIGVRTFFLQPFTIPSGSMQPTLNGIRGYPSEQTAPNILQQIAEFVIRGRNYINVVAKNNGVVVSMQEKKVIEFFTFTDIECSDGASITSYFVWCPLDPLRSDFHVRLGSRYNAGEIIARGAVDAGDHVFVDKLSYNLHMPHRGTVFVFSTRNIPRIERSLESQGIEGSEFYIKRLVGLPGDTLRVDSPRLYIDGQPAQEFGMQRVMTDTADGYNGYSNPPAGDPLSPFDNGASYLTSPDLTYTVPPNHYFAMGDNSYNSSDSRYWGSVPQENLMGRGLFVYWPFYPHWGFVK